ncbi:MAG: hypothetical protein ACRYFS_20275 [Janthinobacterium lividum]
MSQNITQETVGTPTLDQQHQHLKEVHEHLRHASTSDNADEIRERLRRAELALQRHENADKSSS